MAVRSGKGTIVHAVDEKSDGDYLGNLQMPGSHDSFTNGSDISMQDHKVPSKLHNGLRKGR